MTELNVKIADETFCIQCSSPLISKLFSDYTISGKGEIPICPTDEELKKIRAQFIRTDKKYFDEPRRHPMEHTEYHTIHYVMAKALIKRGVLLVHGSAVVADGSAYLFIAPSGTGKSTHTALWKEVLGERAFIINDDKQMIRLTGEVPLVYPTPWGLTGSPGTMAGAPLKAVVLLERSNENLVTQIDSFKMFPHIFQAAICGETPAQTEEILDLERKLLGTTKLYRLKCRADIDAAKTAIKAIHENR